ncbi:MAG: hypothetical protein EOP54_18685 [Sphingobacteriales bacterium]|nr:MAG: hypothetical protein EOP54_18685 [Sphingobacteriales bacterium]
MKNIVKMAGMILLTMIGASSCKKEHVALDLNLSPVGALGTPNDNVNVKLEPTSDQVVLFKWDAASTDDGGLILYELAFDKEGGDFSNPVFKRLSDGSGVHTQVSITHKELNKIANSAGIAASSLGKLKWTVIASKGTNVQAGSSARMLSVERPAGFAENPLELFITGSATEGGTDLSKATKLRRLEEGVFEGYTSLKAGEYILTDKNTEGGKKYFVENGVIKEGATPVTVTGAAKTQRLGFDFTSAVAKSLEIQSIGLYMSAYGKEIGTLNYAGNGVFEASRMPVEFFPFSWGRDERYKFILHTATGAEYMGSSNVNNDAPAGKPAAYFYLHPVSNAQWDNTYKFDPSADRKDVKVNVMFQPEAYTHKITVL